jgi:transposase
MPWKESRVVDQRLQFLSSYQKEEMSLTDLCHEYGISRPTAYKWIKRYNEVGPEGSVRPFAQTAWMFSCSAR